MEQKLDRKLTPLHVWSLALGCIIGWGAFVMPANTFLVKAGPLGTLIAISAAAVIMVIISFNYHYMITRFPEAGGEFVYSKNAFGTIHAFICAWFLGLSYLLVVPMNATALALIGRNLFQDLFQVGFHYEVAGYSVYFGEVALAVVTLLFFTWVSVRGVKPMSVVQMVLVFALVGGVLLIGFSAVLNPEITLSSLEPAFSPDVPRISGTLGVIAVAPWAFCGFDTIPQAAEEFNFSPRKSRRIMILSIVFGAAIYIILNTVTACVTPAGYENWADYLAHLDEQTGLAALPTFHAAYQLMGGVGLLVIGIAVTAAVLSGIVGQCMSSSRLLYSMSKDHVLPAFFSEIHQTYKTPYKSICFVMGISLIAPFFGRTVLGWLVDMSSVGAAIGYGYTSAAAFLYARREGKHSMMITGLAGTLLSLGFIVLLLVPIKLFQCSLSMPSYICLILWSILGIIFYRKAVFSPKSRTQAAKHR